VKKLKKGERVVVYATLNGDPARTAGTVIGVEKDRVRVLLEKKSTWEIWAHPMQTRRLKKRGKRK
jgi:hypothetical protein